MQTEINSTTENDSSILSKNVLATPVDPCAVGGLGTQETLSVELLVYVRQAFKRLVNGSCKVTDGSNISSFLRKLK